MKGTPLVSVIVPTYNSSSTIDICLKSIREQTYPNIEIIVVDNSSVDDTREIAKRYGKVFVGGPERSAQRNCGASHAKGKYLFFVDSDMELARKVVEGCVEKTLKDNSDAIVIPDQISVGNGFWARCKALEKSCYISDKINHNIEAARFFLRNLFWKMNGYDENVTGIEDWDLSCRVKEAGYKVSKIKSFIKHHEGCPTLTTYVKKAYYYAKGSAIYFDKNKKATVEHVILSRIAYLKNRKRLVREPLHGAGMLFMMLCEYVAATIGYMMSKAS